jgi:hypothetical protein
MYSHEKLEQLREDYGGFASWAVWQYGRDNKADTSCIRENLHVLHARYVFVGLNISKALERDWQNFHGGKHDRKLQYALNDTELRGAYLTDMYKNIVEPKATQLHSYIESRPDLLQSNVDTFRKEMSDIEVNINSTFVILSAATSKTADHFNRFFRPHFPSNPVIFHRHYSSRGTDQEWVESMWNLLSIEADYHSIIKNYKENELQF